MRGTGERTQPSGQKEFKLVELVFVSPIMLSYSKKILKLETGIWGQTQRANIKLLLHILPPHVAPRNSSELSWHHPK